jgi:hypothetical protein
MSQAQQLFGNDVSNTTKKQFIALLSQLGFGSGTAGKNAGNFAGNVVKVTFNQANTSQSVPHSLGKTPNFCFPLVPANTQGACLQLISFGPQNVVLACNVANTTFTLYVE